MILVCLCVESFGPVRQLFAELLTGTEPAVTVVADPVLPGSTAAASDAAGNSAVTAAIDGSGTAATVDLSQPAVLPDGQVRA